MAVSGISRGLPRRFAPRNDVALFTLLLDALALVAAGVHIIVTLDLAVVELALLVGALAEVMLELRLGGDDILLPVIGKLQVAARA